MINLIVHHGFCAQYKISMHKCIVFYNDNSILRKSKRNITNYITIR